MMVAATVTHVHMITYAYIDLRVLMTSGVFSYYT